MVELADVITKLVERTDQGRVPWKTAVGESSFSAKLGNLLVLISSRGSGHVKLSVINEKGTEIDSAEHFDFLDSEHDKLADLFMSAKRTALNTDQKLAELMELLDAAPPVEPEEPARNRPGRRA